VIATDAAGQIVRLVCDSCGSQHNFRGGDDEDVTPRARSAGPAAGPRWVPGTFPLVSERERRYAVMPSTSSEGASAPDLELLLRRVIREEIGLTPAVPADKWRGGALVLRPGKPGIQEKSWPIETFFHKVVMLRNRLRVLEQQLNAMEVSEDMKVKLQAYVTACYGTLTSFNVLFADEEDRFQGSASD